MGRIEVKTIQSQMNAVVPCALDHASKSSHNELHADLPVWDSLQKTKQKKTNTGKVDAKAQGHAEGWDTKYY